MNFPNFLIRSLYEEIQVDITFSIYPLRISEIATDRNSALTSTSFGDTI